MIQTKPTKVGASDTVYSIMTVRQLGECLDVTISQSWIVVLSLSHVAMYLTYLYRQ